jgi:hypothetical protein
MQRVERSSNLRGAHDRAGGNLVLTLRGTRVHVRPAGERSPLSMSSSSSLARMRFERQRGTREVLQSEYLH